jgi:hypothetical protein
MDAGLMRANLQGLLHAVQSGGAATAPLPAVWPDLLPQLLIPQAAASS